VPPNGTKTAHLQEAKRRYQAQYKEGVSGFDWYEGNLSKVRGNTERSKGASKDYHGVGNWAGLKKGKAEMALIKLILSGNGSGVIIRFVVLGGRHGG